MRDPTLDYSAKLFINFLTLRKGVRSYGFTPLSFGIIYYTAIDD